MNANETAIPLKDNEYIKDLFNILNETGRDTGGLSAIIGHVGDMEDFLKLAEANIADMKTQLDNLQERANHPIKTALKNAIDALAEIIADIKAQLSALKAGIIESCKEAVAAFKEGGVETLDNLAERFHVKNRLQVVKNGLFTAMDKCDRAVADIEAYAKEYHTIGRAVKNFARIAIGKPPIDARKESGRITKLLCGPARKEKACYRGIMNAVDGVLRGLDNLERKAETQREAKPSLMQKLEAGREKSRQHRERAEPVRAQIEHGAAL